MNYCILSCSGRGHSESHRIGQLIEEHLNELAGTSVVLVDLAELPLTSWDPRDVSSKTPAMQRVIEACETADAVVFVVPEWHGMVPPVLKYTLQHMTGGQISHKPGLLVGISGGPSGTYPVLELRAFGFKNSHLVLVPHHIVIRNVKGVPDSPSGQTQIHRLKIALQELRLYANALASVRAELNSLRDRYSYGM